ncbi:High-affinity lysophosphatidic acid receptor [Holothuria leucospilota]|uniref:High-affinity lysophosphatidic acid receptor n=1 Tax=Holothuria leucospilota TaxID=206669 RepID=A0A9Q1BIZ4_HOLLE|nr:High-affinity lysophosphatidic acid receptor [Holothuria leucospilota]
MVFSTELSTSIDPEASEGLSHGAIVPLAILMIAMIIISALGNSIVCLIVYRKPAMRSAINLLLANLAFADIMVSVTCMPFALVTLIKGVWIFGSTMCQLTAFLYIFFVMEAILILASISVDRYFIIVRRKDKLNPYKAKLLIALSWFCSLIVAFPPLPGFIKFEYTDGYPQCQVKSPYRTLDQIYVVFVFSSLFFIPFIAMSFSYLYILNTVRKNSLRVENHPKSLSISQATKLGLAGVHHRPSRVNVDMSFKTRAFTTILLLFIVYVFCWAPYTVGSMYKFFGDTQTVNSLLWTVLLWLTYLNSAFNPIIYCWRIKKFREACYELMPKTCKLLPHLPGRARRRIRPSAIYECNELEQSSAV